jgi:hypothetical protein
VACLAVDLLALVTIDGVIAGEADEALGQEVLHEEAAEQAGQLQSGPLRLGEDALVAGTVSGCQSTEGAQEVGNASASAGEQGADHQRREAVESRRGEGKTEGGQERLCFVG